MVILDKKEHFCRLQNKTIIFEKFWKFITCFIRTQTDKEKN